MHFLLSGPRCCLPKRQWQTEKRGAEGGERYFNSWISKNIFRGATCQAFVLNNGWQSFLHHIECDNASPIVWSTHNFLCCLSENASLVHHENSRKHEDIIGRHEPILFWTEFFNAIPHHLACIIPSVWYTRRNNKDSKYETRKANSNRSLSTCRWIKRDDLAKKWLHLSTVLQLHPSTVVHLQTVSWGYDITRISAFL